MKNKHCRFLGSLFLAFIFLSILPSSIFCQIILSEVMFDPSGSEYYDEFIEIYNMSTTDTVDLSGWQISDGTGSDVIISHLVDSKLAPEQFGLILDPGYFNSSTQYDSLIPENALILTIDNSTFGSGGLSNSTPENIILINSAGDTVAHYLYSLDNVPGHSDEKIIMNDDDFPENWANSLTVNGTPGFRNSVTPKNYDAAITDIYFSPQKPDRNELITASVIVKNSGRSAINNFLVSLFIDANFDGEFSAQEKYATGEKYTPLLAPGDSVSLLLEFSLSSSGAFDIACILQANDENPANDTLFTNLAVNFSPQDVVINEIMYAPASGSSEWFEIYNRQNFSVNLKDWHFSDQDSGDQKTMTPRSLEMPPLTFAVIAADSSVTSEFDLSQAMLIVPEMFPALNNTGDAIFLFDPNGNIIDQVNFSSDWGGETGISLERINPEISSEDSSNWASCVNPLGATPGIQNSIFVKQLPSQSSLSVSPNPFSPDNDGRDDVTIIQYNLPYNLSRVKISIFDARGRLIRQLTDNQPSGTSNSLIWDGRDNFGHIARVGIYIVLLEAIHYESGRVEKKKGVVVLAK